jgi:hypothetical protein
MANVSINAVRLTCHPATPPVSAKHIDVDVRSAPKNRLFARFSLECDTGSLMLPEPHASRRSDRLWETTCFEIFLKAVDEDRYFEYNFSPSTEWALYRFTDYRQGMAEEMVSRPRISCDYSDSHFALNAEFDLPQNCRAKALTLGLAAVVEEAEAVKSYWAIAHPADQPDFHHKDCFALQLTAPSAA